MLITDDHSNRLTMSASLYVTLYIFFSVIAPLQMSMLKKKPPARDVSTRMDGGSTALSFAITKGRSGVIARLVEAGADAEATVEDELTPLLLAIGQGLQLLMNGVPLMIFFPFFDSCCLMLNVLAQTPPVYSKGCIVLPFNSTF